MGGPFSCPNVRHGLLPRGSPHGERRPVMKVKAVRRISGILAVLALLASAIYVFTHQMAALWAFFVIGLILVAVNMLFPRCPHCKKHLGRYGCEGAPCPFCGKYIP